MNPSPKAAALLNKLRGLKNHASGDGWQAFCPSHDDGKERGLSISEKNGKIVLKCFAGCTVEAVVQSVGLSMADLFEDGGSHLRPTYDPHNKTLQGSPEGRTVSRFTLPDGSIAEHKRLDLPEGKKMWWVRNGELGLKGYPIPSIPLYGDIAHGAVLVVEGETPADAIRETARAQGYSVVATVCGASTIPADEVLSVLKGHYVALWPDNDAPGRQHMTRIAYRLALMKEWPFMVASIGLPIKGDAADFTGDLGDLLRDAMPWNEGEMPAVPPTTQEPPKETAAGFTGW